MNLAVTLRLLAGIPASTSRAPTQVHTLVLSIQFRHLLAHYHTLFMSPLLTVSTFIR